MSWKDYSQHAYDWLTGALTTSPKVQMVGSTLWEQQTESDATIGVLTFAENFAAIEIYNTDAINAGTFEVNGITINVPASGYFKSNVGGTPAKTVTIAGATTYTVNQYT